MSVGTKLIPSVLEGMDTPTKSLNVGDQHMEIVKKITIILDKAHTPSHLERFQFPQLGD